MPTKDKHTTTTNVVAQKVMDNRFGMLIPKAVWNLIYTALSDRHGVFLPAAAAAQRRGRGPATNWQQARRS